MEMRRTPITKPPRSTPAKARRRRTMGMTRWFEIMTATATESTMTMAVAAENPPRNAMMATMPALSHEGQRQHGHVPVDGALGKRRPGPPARSESRRG